MDSGGNEISVSDLIISHDSDRIDFGSCPTCDLQSKVISIKNSGKKEIKLNWEFSAPFSIQPSVSVLAGGDTQNFTFAIFSLVSRWNIFLFIL